MIIQYAQFKKITQQQLLGGAVRKNRSTENFVRTNRDLNFQIVGYIQRLVKKL